MAKRGNFGGFGGGMGNMQNLMRQAQKLQEEALKAQNDIDNTDFSASSGGGMVNVIVSGKRQIKSLEIKPEVVDPDDIDMLQDLIMAAVNEALASAEKTREEKMNKISGGMGGLL